MVQYPYAYHGDKLVSANEAEKYGYFYLLDDQGIQIEMILVKGDIYQPHFRTKHLGSFTLESIEHLQLKSEIAERKWIEYNGLKIEATSVEIEKRHGQLGKNGRRPDLTFIDENGEILCFVEIVHTHRPTDLYLHEAYESNFLIFEIPTHDQKRIIRHLGKRDSLYIERRANEEAQRTNHVSERRIAELNQQIAALKAELYFAEIERFRAGFAKVEGEAGELIRDIAKIEKQIAKIIFG